MKPTTENPPYSVTKSLLYATLVTAAFLLLCSVFNPKATIRSFNFPTTTTNSRQSNPNVARPPTTAHSTDQVSVSPPTNVSHLLFGIAGSAATWKDRSKYATLWWRTNLTRGYVWLDAEPHSVSGTATFPPYKISDPKWKKFRFYTYQSAVRIARILLENFKLGLPDVRWFVMGDDDTVFFPENLATVLGKYDHREMYYVGGNSESVEQDELHSYDMAFGGGGFAISYRLAEELVPILDSCLDRFFHFYGSDQRIWACAAELGVPLTKEPGFHQLDVKGNPYGLLAAHPLAPLVSLHHLDAVESMFPPPKSQINSVKSILQAYRMDPGRILQRSFCYDHSLNRALSVSWGYTVQLWPKVVPMHDMLRAMQTFKTWRYKNGPFTFNTWGVSPDPCEQPVVFYMDLVKENGNESLSSYKREAKMPGQNWVTGCGKPNYLAVSNISRIDVSAMKMELLDWQKAPRRQCCEIVEGADKKDTMKLKLRKCQRGETIFNYLAVSS